MPNDAPDHTASTALAPAALAEDLLSLVVDARKHVFEDPFGNPVLAVALAITRRIDRGELNDAGISGLVRHLRDAAYIDRAARIAAYVGGTDLAEAEAALVAVAGAVVRPDPNDSAVPWSQFRRSLERTRFSAVFTAHPTFANPAPVLAALAEAASGRPPDTAFDSHRPQKITLEEEFSQAVAAITRGRDALDRLNAALLRAAAANWPDRWTDLAPQAVTLASWVGYDTDGRTDIGWWDTLRLRLRMKRLQLQRLQAQLEPIVEAEAISARVAEALAAVESQIDAAPTKPEPDQVALFAEALVGQREAALISPEPLLALFATAIDRADGEARLALCVARAGLVSHGLSLAHSHVRLNSAQLHNAIRQRLGFAEPPADPSRRRVLLAAINGALDEVQPVGVDFGSVMAEQASATRLMMAVAQICKHIDCSAPVRFLIAETESGYTLLAALWLARLLGIERQIEISPLFETGEALESGGRVIEEALRSPHYRSYLQATGRLALQFGYSDSGRYVGQIAASYMIERLRLKVVDALERHRLRDVEVLLFDTHGESIGRGSHPGSLADRLKYLSPSASRQAMVRGNIAWREESAFQGGEGYMLFGTPELATATIARIAEHAFARVPPTTDPIYEEADFAADFFGQIRTAMGELVEDPGYASLLGAFGPALLDPTGSRPAARQSDGLNGPAVIRHPRELRAIPNNAILQQLGWCANTLQGLGAAASRHPEPFTELRLESRRFSRALDLASHGLAHSDIDVLRAVVASLDPGSWLDRADHAALPGRREALVSIARAMERLALWAPTLAMFRRIQADHLALRSAWPDAPHMAAREILLHALRLSLIHRIWLLGTEIPDFSPRFGVTRQALEDRLIRLDVPAALSFLEDVFPNKAGPEAERSYSEPRAPRAVASYAREHAELFQPMRLMFSLVREIGTAITHEVGAFG